MKKLPKILVFLVLGVFLVAGSAMALPTLEPGYHWTSQPYWQSTDLTTATSGTSWFQIRLENASYESDFGLFLPNDLSNPTSVSKKFQVFDYLQGPIDDQTIYFKDSGSGWEISNDNSSWTEFDSVFGFYFDVHTGGTGDATADYSFYSDASLNSVDVGLPHVIMAFNGISEAFIYLDDQLAETPADWDYDDMTVKVNDVAPIPEPATMLLLGSGLIGLAGLGRKKFFKKS